MLSRVAKRKVQTELDLIAEELEKQGFDQLAAEVDEINFALMQDEISPRAAGEELERIAEEAEQYNFYAARKKKKMIDSEEEEELPPRKKRIKKKAYDIARERNIRAFRSRLLSRW